jgi:phage nucleotide-binding protein
MAISLKSTKGLHANGVKMLVYSHAGAGKTSLIPTLPSPIVLSAEGGLLSISDSETPFIEINSMTTLMEAYQWLTESKEAEQFESVALDSISEIAEVVLAEELKKNKDGRAAYGELNSVMTGVIRSFRDLPNRNVYFTAKCEKIQDETGRILYGPSMPGKSLSQGLGYFFDLVMPLRVEKDQDGKIVRALMTDSDGLWQAKNRAAGKLDAWEAPDLGAIIKKIGGK